jgi:acetyl esterase/lipase
MSVHPGPRTRRATRALGAAVALTLLSAALPATAAQATTTTAAQATTTQAAAPPIPQATTWEYLPGVEADLYLPARQHPRPRTVPLIVMVPGGGWQTADRTGLGQLAEAFAGAGVAVTNTTYRIGDAAARFPVPAQDVTCAVDASVAAVRRAGLRPGPVVLLGHSAGAHLSSLAAFGAKHFRTTQCRYPRTTVDGWVGLSGIYDLTLVGEFAWPMMGATAEEAPEAYATAATETYLARRGCPHIDTLVAHGDADDVIPSFVATGFADLLRDRGYQTQVEIVPGADHQAIYQAPVIADTVLTWLRQVESCRGRW